MKKKPLYSVTTEFNVEFFDVDAMQVAWHGNYVKYMEIGRCSLLEKLGFGYKEMIANNYAFPVTKLNIKYIKSLHFGEKASICADLLDFEYGLNISYVIFNEKGEITTKAETSQMALNLTTNESEFSCPTKMIQAFKKTLNKEK